MEKKINLEEILYKHYNLMFAAYSVKDKDNKFTPVVDRNGALNAMKEACRQSLELAAENAENNVKGKYVDWINWFSKDEISFSSDDSETVIVKINKQSIINTINQIE